MSSIDKITSQPGIQRELGRVAVLMGGTSSEREISLLSGQAVLGALRRLQVNAFAVDGLGELLPLLQTRSVDRVFNVLHGQHGGGEDGVLQGLLDAYGVAYTGSGVMASALTMDKIRTKQVWLAMGLPTPRYRALQRQHHSSDAVIKAARQLGLPVIVKPACEGSSVGVSRVHKESDLDSAVELASRYPGDMLMEQLITGSEFSVPVLGNEALPSIRIVPKGEYYDFNAKYVAEDTQYVCPGLQGDDELALRSLVLSAFKAVGCRGWGRIDVMRDEHGNNYLLEVNTAPGMTSHSLVPKAAASIGISFDDLVVRILESSAEGSPWGVMDSAQQMKKNATAVPAATEQLTWLRLHRRRLGWLSLTLGMAVILWFAVRGVVDRPLQKAEISGKFAQVSRVQIEQVLAPLRGGGFLSIDLNKVKQAIEAIRWVDHARVERVWPDGLRVYVVEQVAIARWGQQGLLNTRGELFTPDAHDVRADLPQLSGPLGAEAEVSKLYLQTYPRLLTVGLTLSRVTLNERGAWVLQLANGIEVRLGREDVAERLERFIRAASPVVATRTGEIAYVDMRYSNGFSIGWGRPSIAPSSDQSGDPATGRPIQNTEARG